MQYLTNETQGPNAAPAQGSKLFCCHRTCTPPSWPCLRFSLCLEAALSKHLTSLVHTHSSSFCSKSSQSDLPGQGSVCSPPHLLASEAGSGPLSLGDQKPGKPTLCILEYYCSELALTPGGSAASQEGAWSHGYLSSWPAPTCQPCEPAPQNDPPAPTEPPPGGRSN